MLLGCVGRVDFDDHTTSFRRFVVQSLFEVAPARVHDALAQMWIANHVRDLQIFNGDEIIGLHKLVRQLVDDVLALIADMLSAALDRAQPPLAALAPAL